MDENKIDWHDIDHIEQLAQRIEEALYHDRSPSLPFKASDQLVDDIDRIKRYYEEAQDILLDNGKYPGFEEAAHIARQRFIREVLAENLHIFQPMG